LKIREALERFSSQKRCGGTLVYSFNMRWWRRSRLLKGVVMILLLWTAADLTNGNLCALENEDAPLGLPSTSVTLVHGGSQNQIPPTQPSQHIDDCFCCSHCVEVQTLLPATVAVPIVRQRTSLVLPAPRIFGSALYHPPLA
jgi:hypothetical protein